MTALGEFEDNLDKYREIDWIIFLICCIFNIILLLNLLIAVISETYERVSAERHERRYKEKVYQISLLQDTIFGIKKSTNPDPNELCFVAQVINEIEDSDEWLTGRVQKLNERLDATK